VSAPVYFVVSVVFRLVNLYAVPLFLDIAESLAVYHDIAESGVQTFDMWFESCRMSRDEAAAALKLARERHAEVIATPYPTKPTREPSRSSVPAEVIRVL
jgi:hypothetical protein